MSEEANFVEGKVDTDAKLTAILEGLTESIQQMRRQSATPAKAPEPKTQERVYSRAELKKLVDSGSISEDQAEAYLDQVRERQIESKLSQKLERDLTSRQRTEKMNARIDAFVEARPELSDPKSDECKALQRRFDRLVSDLELDPDDPRTKVLALEQEFGSPEALKPAVETTRERVTRKTSGSSGQGKKSTSSPLDKLPKGLRSHYEDQLNSGHFKGPDDPRLLREVTRIVERRESRA